MNSINAILIAIVVMLVATVSVGALNALLISDPKVGVIAYFVVTMALAAALKWWQDRGGV
jgi:hypothetical protein